MDFSFLIPTKHKGSLPLHSEPILIGCEAWVDVSRFCADEKSSSKPVGDRGTAGDRLHSNSSQNSLRQSFSDLRRRFRRSFPEDLD